MLFHSPRPASACSTCDAPNRSGCSKYTHANSACAKTIHSSGKKGNVLRARATDDKAADKVFGCGHSRSVMIAWLAVELTSSSFPLARSPVSECRGSHMVFTGSDYSARAG
ncbi:MAG: hypothetical protein ACOYIK_08050 [Coriobacteriales bacterium]